MASVTEARVTSGRVLPRRRHIARELGPPEIASRTLPNNLASLRVMEKLGSRRLIKESGQPTCVMAP